MGKESPRQLLSSSHWGGLGVGEGVELMSGNTPFNDAPSNSADQENMELKIELNLKAGTMHDDIAENQ